MKGRSEWKGKERDGWREGSKREGNKKWKGEGV